MDEFEKKKRELLGPLFFEAGAALFDCQQMEYGLTMMLLHLSHLGAIGLKPEDVFRILENQDKKTAGQLVHMLKKHSTVSPEIETALAEGLDARNAIIHRVLGDNVEKFARPETRAEVIREIKRLRSKVRAADKALSPFIHGLSEALFGIDKQKLEDDWKQLFS